jgi:hypothetical protein
VPPQPALLRKSNSYKAQWNFIRRFFFCLANTSPIHPTDGEGVSARARRHAELGMI